jgi:hypothetical protein
VIEEEPYEEIEEEPAVEEPYIAPAPRRKPAWEKPFIIGVRGGFNWSSVGYTYPNYYAWAGYFVAFDVGEPYGKAGGNLGVYMVANTSRFLAWVVEMDLSQKGYAVDLIEDDFGFDAYQTNFITFNYLEFPLLVKFKFPGAFSPYAVAGVYLSLWLSGTLDIDYDDDFYTDISTDLLDSDWNSFDFGWVAGLGIDIFIGTLVLNAEVKYSGGFLYADAYDALRNGALTATAGVGWAF